MSPQILPSGRDFFRARMDARDLDSLSMRFADAIFAIYPGWVCFARHERKSGVDQDHLVLEILAPAASDLVSTLLIHTANGEVTVGFDYWHSHYFDQGSTTAVSIALADIAAIIDDEIAAVSGWDNQTWRGSWTIAKGEDPAAWTALDTHPMTRLRVRSWSGKLDSDRSLLF